MSDRSSIEWTDATWNPVTGCTKVSPGCDNCYALTLAERFRGTRGHYFENGFDVQLRPDKLARPIRWKKPRRIFVNSMSDLFHDQVPDDYIAQVFAVMAAAPQHTFQVLTKRHGRMRSLLSSVRFDADVIRHAQRLAGEFGVDVRVPRPLPNVWLGVSVEDQKWADIRIPALLMTPAAMRFLSMEPLLGPVDLTRIAWSAGGGTHLDVVNGRHGVPDTWQAPGKHVDWVIVGGESGRGARPMHPDWVRSLRDQCTQAGVPYHFKQWGAWQNGSAAADQRGEDHIVHRNGEHARASQYADSEIVTGPAERRMGACFMSRVGKHASGRELDGRTWDEFPQAVI